MLRQGDLQTIEDEVRRLNGDFSDPKDEETFRTSVVILAAALCGDTDVDDLAEFTGYPTDFIAAISERMHAAGLWEDGDVHDEHWWADDQLEKVQLTPFWLDVLFAKGCVLAMRMADGQFVYRAARFGPWGQHRVV